MPPSTSVRELDDDSIAILLEAYIDRAGDPLVLLSAPLTELCAALYWSGERTSARVPCRRVVHGLDK